MGMFDWMGDIGQAVAIPVAADMQKVALGNARQTQQQQYGQDQGYYQPYYNAGTGALGQLSNNVQNGAYNVNVTPQNLQNDPGYQFQLQQGQQALQRSAAAGGGLMSGGFMKSLDQYSQGLASTQYQNAWNRQFQQNQMNYNQLANLAGMGERSAGNLAGLGERYGNTMAGYDIGLGNINSGALMGQVGAGGRAASGFTNMGVDMATSAAGMPGGLGGLGGGGGKGLSAGNPDSMMPMMDGGYGSIPQQSGGYGGGQSLGGIGYAPSIPQQQGFGAGYADPYGGWGGY